MGDDHTPGVRPAVDLLLAEMGLSQGGGGAGERARRDEQLALWPSAAELGIVGDEERAERRGPGRPAGSRNRTTEQFVQFIRANYRDPRLFLAEVYNRPVEELARQLGCKRDEALKLQITAANDLAPYVAQKQPLAVQVSAAGIVTLNILMPGDPLPGAGAADDGYVIEGEVLSDQGVSGEPPDELDRTELDK